MPNMYTIRNRNDKFMPIFGQNQTANLIFIVFWSYSYIQKIHTKIYDESLLKG